MYQHLTECQTHAENMKISFCFCKTCICLKILENIQISVNMIHRLDITDEYSYLEYSYFYRGSVKYFIKKMLKM